MRSWRAEAESETEEVGRQLGAELAPHGVLLLTGDLGAGKTVLARGVGAALGVDPAEVQSPTFILMRDHEGRRGRMVHVDLYRLEPAEVASLGLEEILAGPGVKVVEWAERIPFPVDGAVRIEIRRIAPASSNTRALAELAAPAEIRGDRDEH